VPNDDLPFWLCLFKTKRLGVGLGNYWKHDREIK
jgi:hypothetical protein